MSKTLKILLLVFILAGTTGFVLFNPTSQGLAQNNIPFRVKSPAPETELPSFAADQLIVKFRSNASSSAMSQLKAAHGATETRKSKSGGFVRLALPVGSDVLAKAQIFTANPLVEYAHPNYFAQAHFVPNDTFYNFQWHFDDDNTNNTGGASTNPSGGANGGGIRMEEAWDTTTGSASVIVAVLDTGVAYEDFSDPNAAGCYNLFGVVKKCTGKAIDEYFQGSDLANTSFLILTGSDMVNSDDHPNDDESHGTHVTGTVAQSTNNSLGVAGIAFDTTIMPIKILDGNGSGLFDVIADGIIFATDQGADIINMSLGSEFNAQVMEDAVQYAFDAGVTVVASAGNSALSGNPVNYPAAYDAYVIAVGATRYDETRPSYSSTGSYVDIAAPGGDNSVDQNEDGFVDGVLQQTFGTNDPSDFAYFFFQGTSMASPHIAAVAALLLAKNPSMTPSEIRTAIESTAEDKGTAGRDDEYGFGLVDVKAALDSVAAVSIVLNTDGTTEFDIRTLGETVDTTASGTNDVQTIEVTTGPVDLDVKSTDFSDNGNTWILGTTNGANQVKWEFSKNGTDWLTFSSANTLFSLDINVAQGASRNLFLRLTMPSSTSSTNEHSTTVTIVATTP